MDWMSTFLLSSLGQFWTILLLLSRMRKQLFANGSVSCHLCSTYDKGQCNTTVTSTQEMQGALLTGPGKGRAPTKWVLWIRWWGPNCILLKADLSTLMTMEIWRTEVGQPRICQSAELFQLEGSPNLRREGSRRKDRPRTQRVGESPNRIPWAPEPFLTFGIQTFLVFILRSLKKYLNKLFKLNIPTATSPWLSLPQRKPMVSIWSQRVFLKENRRRRSFLLQYFAQMKIFQRPPAFPTDIFLSVFLLYQLSHAKRIHTQTLDAAGSQHSCPEIPKFSKPLKKYMHRRFVFCPCLNTNWL